jgi:hypothetical protein
MWPSLARAGRLSGVWVWQAMGGARRNFRTGVLMDDPVFLMDDGYSDVPNDFFYLPRFCDYHDLKPYY